MLVVVSSFSPRWQKWLSPLSFLFTLFTRASSISPRILRRAVSRLARLCSNKNALASRSNKASPIDSCFTTHTTCIRFKASIISRRRRRWFLPPTARTLNDDDDDNDDDDVSSSALTNDITICKNDSSSALIISNATAPFPETAILVVFVDFFFFSSSSPHLLPLPFLLLLKASRKASLKTSADSVSRTYLTIVSFSSSSSVDIVSNNRFGLAPTAKQI